MKENVLKFIRNPSSFAGLSKEEIGIAHTVLEILSNIVYAKFNGNKFYEIPENINNHSEVIEILRDLGYQIEETTEFEYVFHIIWF